MSAAADKGPICVVGLGYVGLPLAVLFGREFEVVGYDINPRRVEELSAGHDRTREVSREALAACGVEFTTDAAAIAACRLVVVTVPTPIDAHRNPDLGPVLGATRTVGRHMVSGTTVVYESTVYPGLTEEECVPLLEAESGLTWRRDFHVGYSPERVNPGDRRHTIDRICKVISGDSDETLALLREVYGRVITAGLHEAPDIRTAEAAKVIENTQRDLNIGLMNELAILFDRMGIDTRQVLAAAGSKWNFLPFEPGLVGGHCIGVDPYYLTYKAEAVGYHPQMILAGRRLNDSMARHVAQATVKKLIDADRKVKGSKVLVLGLTFKEDIADIRNTKVVDVVRALEEFGLDVRVHDAHAWPDEVRAEYGIELLESLDAAAPYDAFVLAVKHGAYVGGVTLERLRSLASPGAPVLVDVKGMFSPQEAAAAGFRYWRL